MTTAIQFRVEQKIKDQAKKVFSALGLDMSSGMKMYLSQVARTRTIPVEMFTADNFSREKQLRLIREADEALVHGKRYGTVEELHDEILGH